MGTKDNPATFDCYAHALPDEPMFVLLARDPDFYRLVLKWGARRLSDIQCGERPLSDMAMVLEANDCAITGAEWRKNNLGKWRRPTDRKEVMLNEEGTKRTDTTPREPLGGGRLAGRTTPGPWSTALRKDGEIIMIVDSGDSQIAWLENDSEIAEIDARLIAAAPDLIADNEKLKEKVEEQAAIIHGMQDGALVRDQMALIDRLTAENEKRFAGQQTPEVIRIMARVAEEQYSDPETDDLTVPLALECAKITAENQDLAAENERLRELLRWLYIRDGLGYEACVRIGVALAKHDEAKK
jgi:hypothetical protein